MKKALLMVLSGALIALTSFSHALTQGEMEDAISRDTGLSKEQSHNALDAYEKQLKKEMSEKRAVKLDNHGTYRPRELAGTRTGRTLSGGQTTYDNWKLVKNYETVEESVFNQRAAERAGMSLEDYTKASNAYKSNTAKTLRKGGSVYMHGEGTYSIGKVKERIYKKRDGTITSIRPAYKKIRYKGYGKDNKQQFTADDALTKQIN